MSYEGYNQVLCEKGHYHTFDAYDSYSRLDWKCPVCQSKVAWDNSVNLTNGSYEGKKRIDGYVKLKIDVPSKTCVCKKCKNKHKITECTYKIPKKK